MVLHLWPENHSRIMKFWPFSNLSLSGPGSPSWCRAQSWRSFFAPTWGRRKGPGKRTQQPHRSRHYAKAQGREADSLRLPARSPVPRLLLPVASPVRIDRPERKSNTEHRLTRGRSRKGAIPSDAERWKFGAMPFDVQRKIIEKNRRLRTEKPKWLWEFCWFWGAHYR